MLSKSKYTKGENCEKALWLYVHKKNEQVISEETYKVFARGTATGELAQEYFPNGKMAVLEDYPGYQSAKRTQELIEQGVEVIYEATFIYEDTLVAVDILAKVNDQWHLFEVKSTNSTKPQHIIDVAIQDYVVSGCGLDLIDASLMHFDREYVRKGDVEPRKLFTYDSVLEQVLPLQQEIKNKIPEFHKMLTGDEPKVEMGKQCTSPYDCAFYDYCSKLLPPIEEEEPEILSSTPVVDKDGVKSFVESVEYPLYHLDFETIMPGVPMFNESRPYQQIPFQYSLHHQNERDGELFHEEYLAESTINIDPREQLIKQLIEQTKPAKTIFVYHKQFEETRIREMCRDFPEYAKELDSIIDRLVDLIIPFKKKYYRTETMEESSSIKKVLPALYPELTYSELDIGDGMTASNSFLDLYYCDDKKTIQLTRKHLLEYCHLDTLAMYKLFEVLKRAY